MDNNENNSNNNHAHSAGNYNYQENQANYNGSQKKIEKIEAIHIIPFVLAIVGAIASSNPFTVLLSIAAVVIAHIAVSKTSVENRKSLNMSYAALIIGYIGVGIFLLDLFGDLDILEIHFF